MTRLDSAMGQTIVFYGLPALVPDEGGRRQNEIVRPTAIYGLPSEHKGSPSTMFCQLNTGIAR